MFLRSQLATIGAISYLIAFLAASLYPHISRQTFAGLPAITLLWPWIELLHPASQVARVACAAVNAAIIYTLLAFLAALWSRLPSRR